MILWLLLVLIVLLYLVACVLYYFLQEKMLYKRKRFRQNFKYHYDFPFEELFWKTADGNTLNGLRFTVENPKGVILFLHGNSGHMGRSGNYFKRVKDLNYDVVMYDYRGYGKSTGTPTKATFYNDVIQIFDWIKENYPELPIVIHGLSLGSHVATYVAAHRTVRLLIMETPFLSLARIAKIRYPILPGALLLKHRLNSADFLPEIACPIHVFHGDKDNIVPITEAQCIPLYNGHVKMTVIKGGNHKNLHDFPQYQHTLEELLKEI
jgi:uncharacterized protein